MRTNHTGGYEAESVTEFPGIETDALAPDEIVTIHPAARRGDPTERFYKVVQVPGGNRKYYALDSVGSGPGVKAPRDALLRVDEAGRQRAQKAAAESARAPELHLGTPVRFTNVDKDGKRGVWVVTTRSIDNRLTLVQLGGGHDRTWNKVSPTAVSVVTDLSSLAS